MTPTVGYLTKRFPRLSETFILDEILGLEAAGVPLRLYGIMDPGEQIVQPDVARVRSAVTYLRPAHGWRQRAASAAAIAAAHVRLLMHRPGPYASVVLYIVRRRRRRAAVLHFLEAGRFALLLERDGAAHVHAAFAHGPASIAHFVHLLTGLPFSFSAHAKDIYLSPPDLLAEKVAAAEFVLVCSESAARTLRGIARPTAVAIRLAYHGVDTERFQPAPADPLSGPAEGHAARPLRVLAVGRLVEKKGYPVLLDALARVREGGRSLTCTIIGEGPRRATLEAQVEQLGLTGVVSFRGACTQPEIVDAYRAADVFVQASVVLPDGDRDGVPNSVLEAMASGLPVVASAVAGIPEAVVDGAAGLLVPAGDASALAAALRRLCDDPLLRSHLGDGARRHVLAHFDRRTAIHAIAPLFTNAPPIAREVSACA